ncbi:uncharacterized protein LOC132637634 [Lycium barbarum]|uniref:uncharacterized protein LOC132637634 n=1 Tax=Lycium barbarum TaxID=112863 RepID=UPI00293EAA32|nr:uncharacterized protein LOC132637634 [Lycium barbarum]
MAYNGRIWLLWKQSIQLQAISITEQLIHCKVENNAHFSAFLTVVYAKNEAHQRQSLWTDLNQIGSSTRGAWLIAGDFNTMLSSDDRLRSPVLPVETQDFRDCVYQLQLTPLKSKGWHFTFCNKQQATSRVYSKIDWAFGNIQWLQSYGHVEADFLNLGMSDNSPILIQYWTQIQTHPKPFKLFTTVLNHPDFPGILATAWGLPVRGTKIYILWRKFMLLKENLKGLNSYLASYSQRLQQARQSLEITQASLSVQPMNQALIDQERITLMEIAKWSKVEELALRQKSRAIWIKCGDSNTKYFHAQYNIRASRNTINFVYNDIGTKVTDPTQVEAEFISFFTKLMGTDTVVMPYPNSEIIRKGPCHSHQQKCDLIRAVSEVEILDTIKGMPSDKSPGIDGYPIEFFNRNWDVVKGDVLGAVAEFFQSGKMPKSFSGTAVTLIPKISNPTLVKDYRPIACCTTFYKIITKVLTNRIKTVIADILSIKLVQKAFNGFSAASGLHANVDKSSIYLSGVKPELKQEILRTLRLQLIKSVLFGVQTYWAQIFILPKRVMKLVDAVCRSFLWSGKGEVTKKELVSWARICLPKSAGGQNVMNICLWNKAAVIKQLWAIVDKKDSLWIRWVNIYYLKNDSVDTCNIPGNATWVIRKVIETRKFILQTNLLQGDFNARLAYMVKNNKFSIKSMYVSLIPIHPKVPWKSLTMQPSIHPRQRFILWLAVHKRLATAERLRKFRIKVPLNCVYCNSPVESFDHLFFSCVITNALWQRLLVWLGFQRAIGNWQDELQWVCS